MYKIAVVTGASRGIGRQIVKELAMQGYAVVINYNKSESKAITLQSEITALGGRSCIYKADVSIFSEAKGLIDFTLENFGTVDLLVNNAGIAEQKLFNCMEESDWDRMIASNLKSVFNCSRMVIDVMLKKHSGNIINISSMWGEIGSSCEVHYSASKAAVIGFTKALAKEVAPNGIRVNCVSPGVIKTDMMNDFNEEDINILKNDTPLMRIGTVKDIANAVCFLASEESSFITGQVIGVNGGFVI